MKIGYFLHLNFPWTSGVFLKVVEQVTQWTSMGHEVVIVIVTTVSENPEKLVSLVPQCKVFGVTYSSGFSVSGIISRCRAIERGAGAMLKACPDVVYMRQDVYYPSVTRLARAIPTVVEVNTDDLKEIKSLSNGKYIYHRITRSNILGLARGVVFVTREIQARPWFRQVIEKSIVIPNGYPMFNVPEMPYDDSVRETVVFMGTPGLAWHGVDKIYDLAIACPKMEFYLIGGDFNLRPERNAPNMRQTGVLKREAFRSFLDRAAVGIGSLALHRIGMNEACTLKTREYLAHGVPVILGHKDADFEGHEDFICAIGNFEDNIRSNLQTIITFIEKWRTQRVRRSNLDHLCVSRKEATRLEYFKRVLAE